MISSNKTLRITSATVNVEVPMHTQINLFKERELYQWVAFFTNLRDNEQNTAYKRNYDRCQFLLKYAYSFWGELKEVSNGKESIIFTFKFDDISKLNVFIKDLPNDVESGIM